jgi:hypothetical protein
VGSADVDGDGLVDVLSASRDDDTVAWYENDGTGSFTTHVITTSADGAYSVGSADVDGDLDVDVLSASFSDDTVAWYQGPDSDTDGLLDAEEEELGTDPDDPDSDADGLEDGPEVDTHGTDPLDPDTDADNLDDASEVRQTGTDPTASDTDGDGVPDAEEDPDEDGLTHGEEVDTYGTDPLDSDTDGDAYRDGTEVAEGSSPTNPASVPTLVGPLTVTGLTEGERLSHNQTGGPLVETDDNGNVAVYDDEDGDGQPDEDEEIATVPPDSEDGPTVNVSDTSVNQTVPAQQTTEIESRNVSTDPVTTPSTCDVEGCEEEVTLVPGQNESTPRIDPDERCTPFGTLCVDPAIESQNVSTDPVKAGPACEGAADELCLGPVTVLPGQDESTPHVDPIQVTPETVVSVEVTNTTASVDEFGTEPIGPTNVTIETPFGDQTITVCENPSPVCREPVFSFTATSEIEFYLRVGEDAYSASVPIDAGG